jgi:CheY-like chemotaxis protein
MLRILVAEDDRNLAHYYETLLRQWNCETVVEHTGTDAIRRAATFRPDIALLGVVMPKMGGVEAGIKLLEICPGTKIVLVTESVPPETLEQLEAQVITSRFFLYPLPARSCTHWCSASRQSERNRTGPRS